MKAVIMRGLPGSGKSTKAREVAGSHGVIHSTDEYFIANGKYILDISKLKEYHEENFKAFVESLKKRLPVVVCDNTNSQKWEYERYITAAKSEGYEVEVISLPHPLLKVCVIRNTHQVPLDVIKMMLDQWEP